MQALKKIILQTLQTAAHAKSPEAETDLILFYLLKNEGLELDKLSDLTTQEPAITALLASDAKDRIQAEALQIATTRAQGTPLQQVLGVQYFYDHEYKVSNAVLIPRPETEILIHIAIQYLQDKFGSEDFTFAELGLGSGILSTEILAHLDNGEGFASEWSEAAILIAKENLSNIIGPDWEGHLEIIKPTSRHEGFEIFLAQAPFDLIISNPPYVARTDQIEDEVLKHEPDEALFPELNHGAENPNFFYESFLIHHHQLLKPDGLALFEIPHERAEELLALFHHAGLKDSVLVDDLTGRPRVLIAPMG